MLIILLLVVSQLIEGNGYETRKTSKGLIKEQTLMLRRASALHNLLFIMLIHYA